MVFSLTLDSTMAFKKILVGLDFSPLSQIVFSESLELAMQNQAQLFLFHSINAEVLMTPPPFSGELGLSPHLIDQAYQVEHMRFEQQTQQARDSLALLSIQAKQQGVTTHFDYQVAEAGAGLCNKAKDWGADLIVVGRRGRRGLAEALLGSVSNFVLHNAPCTVLVIQGEDKVTSPSLEEETVAEAVS